MAPILPCLLRMVLALSMATLRRARTATRPMRRPTSFSWSSFRILFLASTSDVQVPDLRTRWFGDQVSHMVLQHAFLPWRPWFGSSRTVLNATGEIIGYVGRVGSAFDVTYNNYFLMQVVCLVISPAFFSAALYLTIGNLYVLSSIFC